MKARVDYFCASGAHHHNVAFLAHRYDPDVGFQRLESESIVVTVAPGDVAGQHRLNTVFQSTGWFVGLWRSADGKVYVAESFGEVASCSRPENTGGKVLWQRDKLGAGLNGIWGLTDELVFAWGTRKQAPVLFLFNGKSWDEITPPSFSVNGMHGLSRDTVWACGDGGRVAHWSGNSWQEMVVPGAEPLINLHVAKPDELYAVGVTGAIFEGSSYGWGNIGRIPNALQGDVQAVAVFADTLWVGASRLGLWTRKGKTNEYECPKPNIPAVSFDTRGEFIIGSQTSLIWTTDGKSFPGTGRNFVAQVRGDKPFGAF